MALYRWPTDPAGKPAKHTISWEKHQANLKAKTAPGDPTIPGSEPEPPQSRFDPNAPLPIDAAYDDEMAAIQKGLDTTRAGITGERTRGLAEYGFTETGYDPMTGAQGALAFDPNNPFSKAALLKGTYDKNRSIAGQSMASSGRLDQGAYQHSQDLLNADQLRDEDTLQKSLTAFLASNQGDWTRAGSDAELAGGEALGRRVGRALDNPLYNPIPTPDLPKPPSATQGGVGTATTKTSGTPALKDNVLTAGPDVRKVKGTRVKTTKKGKTVTHSTSVTRA